jgi:hypothetical protein
MNIKQVYFLTYWQFEKWGMFIIIGASGLRWRGTLVLNGCAMGNAWEGNKNTNKPWETHGDRIVFAGTIKTNDFSVFFTKVYKNK